MKEKLKLIVKKKRVIVPAAALIIVGVAKASGHPIAEQEITDLLNAILNLFGN